MEEKRNRSSYKKGKYYPEREERRRENKKGRLNGYVGIGD